MKTRGLRGHMISEGKQLVVTIVVRLTLLGAGDPGEQEGIDFRRKPIASPVTPGMPPTPSLQNRIDFFEKFRPLYRRENRGDRTA